MVVSSSEEKAPRKGFLNGQKFSGIESIAL